MNRYVGNFEKMIEFNDAYIKLLEECYQNKIFLANGELIKKSNIDHLKKANKNLKILCENGYAKMDYFCDNDMFEAAEKLKNKLSQEDVFDAFRITMMQKERDIESHYPFTDLSNEDRSKLTMIKPLNEILSRLIMN